MEQWSSNGREAVLTKAELVESCGKGHRTSLQLTTGPGGRICLLCLSKLISDRNAFLIHRTFAVEELSTALTDELFCRELLNRHPQFLVAPLSDAIGSSTDDSFSKGIMDVILSLCNLARDAYESLLQDFIRQIARQLGCPSLWNPHKHYTLHLMGLLLELHCKQEFCVPQAVRNQQDFVPNLISGLQLPGEDLQGEILFVLYKLASLEDDVEELLGYSPQLCHAAIHALLKTESDALRINCLGMTVRPYGHDFLRMLGQLNIGMLTSCALLNVMAGRLLFDIRHGGSNSHRGGNLQSSKRSGANREPLFAKTFAESMKGSLLSSDLQVQAAALQLICLVFPEQVCHDKELQILVEEGIADYVFEIIRLSDNQESIQTLAVDVLNLLSAEEHLFPQRFKFGLETVLHVLEKSIDAPSLGLQTNILNLLSRSLSDLSEILSTARAEHLLLLLTKILQYHAKLVEDHDLIGDTTVLPPTFKSACLALVSLTQAPCCVSIPNVTKVFQTATASAILSATSRATLSQDPSSLKYSAWLLKAVYQLNELQVLDNGADNTAESLIELCELHLLPAFTDNQENLEDEILVLSILQTFTLLLKSGAFESNTYRFALRLAASRCFSLSFELMARFPARVFRERAYEFLSALVDKLAGGNTKAYIEKALPHLPGDPSDLLILLEQRSAENQQLLSVHHAIIAILSTSYSFDDRLAKELDIMASLEQHLLVNHGSALVDGIAPETILKQFVSLYVSAKDALKDWDTARSVQAETILELVLRRSSCDHQLVCSETPKPVLKWFLCKESLKDISMVQILTWFTTVENKYSVEGPQVVNSAISANWCNEEPGSRYLVTLAELIGGENCGTTVLMSLFDKLVMQGVDDGVRVVAKTLTKLARMSVVVGHQLVQQGFISSVQQMIRIYASKTSDSIIESCLELLFQLLYDSDPSSSLDVMADRSWVDIANQCAGLVLGMTISANRLEVLAPLSVINLILHKSYECDFFTQACELLVCNKDLCAKLEALVVDASSQGAKLSRMDSTSDEGERLCAVITFSLLRLRCAIRFRNRRDNLSFGPEVHYIGLQTSVYPDTEANSSTFSETSLACEHWCRILYFGHSTMKMLASCCIGEIFSQLPSVTESAANDVVKLKELDLPINFLMAVTMVLQGSILGDSEQIRKNAGYCLYRLLSSNALSSQQKRAVASSSWNHMLFENLIFSLSTPNFKQDSGTCRLKDFSAAYVAVGLLKMSLPQPCLSSLFSHSSITNMVSNLSEDDISPIIVSFFHELLLSKFLTNDHVRILRDLFQATRRKAYEREPSLHSEDRQSHARHISSRILDVEHSTHSIIHSAILELAITFRNEALESFSNDFENSGTSHANTGAVISMLDTFVQDSYLQFQ